MSVLATKSAVLWYVTRCRPAESYQRLENTLRLRLQIMSSLNFKSVASSKSSVNAKRLYFLETITHIKLRQSIIFVNELVFQ
jgi:hypothetical protein